MKRFLLHIFLCGVLAVAPSMAWSEDVSENGSGDVWWDPNGTIMQDADARITMHDLRVDNLSTDKLVKFIVALPRGPEFANRVMNDPANKITFLESSASRTKTLFSALAITGGVLGAVGIATTLILVCGGTVFLFQLWLVDCLAL